MWTRTKSWMHLALCATLAFGVAMFVGCGGGSDSGDGGGDSSDTGGDGKGGDNASGNGDHDDGGSAANGDNGNGGNTAGGSVTIDHGSPEALFASMLDAGRAQDYKAVADAYSPAIQRDMAAGMVVMAVTADMNPAVDKAELMPILERHGITNDDLPAMGPQMQPQAEALVDGLDNMTGFVGDMMSTLPDFTQGFTDTFGDTAVNATTLTDLEINGDEASAQITAAGQTSGEERRVSFVRIDGKWYVTD